MVIPRDIEPQLREEHAGNQVADGVYWFSANMTNWYLVEDDDGLTMVDSGLPGHRALLESGLERLGATLADIEAVILTHADPDHMDWPSRSGRKACPCGSTRTITKQHSTAAPRSLVVPSCTYGGRHCCDFCGPR